MRRDVRMSKSGKSDAYWGQSRKMEGRLRATKPEKLSQRASRNEEEKKDKIERDAFSHKFIIQAGTLLSPRILKAVSLAEKVRTPCISIS
jgi:hypothetical protein